MNTLLRKHKGALLVLVCFWSGLLLMDLWLWAFRGSVLGTSELTEALLAAFGWGVIFGMDVPPAPEPGPEGAR